jgi:hydrogenase nickel incorporation protein HypB
MSRTIELVEPILGANDQVAQTNHELLDSSSVFAVNIMASPGSGKTSLILRTIAAVDGSPRIGVIEGDVASQVDADKVAEAGVPVVQINTQGGCHLEAVMVRQALQSLPLDNIDLLFIENVGNLVCPVGFRLGEHVNAMIISVPEGSDKPYKYPSIFATVDAIVVNKLDLLPYCDFDLPAFRELVTGLNPEVRIFPLSCRTGEGLPAWTEWLREALCTQ